MNADDSAGFELIGDEGRPGPFVFTCEHASNAMPPWLKAADGDARFLDDHWGWDIGARDVTHTLVERLGGQAVLSRCSRLVVDTNRDPTDPTYIRREVEGHAISFNKELGPHEVERRTSLLFDPYHDAIDRMIAARRALGPVHMVAVHSFTPVFCGTPRSMEIGVLYDDYEQEAALVQSALIAQGFGAVLNEPYSGKPPSGLIYGCRRHGGRHGIKYLELEIRQDLVASPDTARAVAARIAAALEPFWPPR